MSDPTDLPTPATPPAPTSAPALVTPLVRPTNGIATAGFVLALVGFLGCAIPLLGIPAVIVAVIGGILALVGLSRARRSAVGKGLAVTGIVLAAVAAVVGVVVNVAALNSDALEEIREVVASSSPAATDDDVDDAGSTREDPAPLGSAIEGEDWTVVVNSVTTTDRDTLGQAPADGMTLLVVSITATYNGTDAAGSTPFATVDYVTGDGRTIDSLDGDTLYIPVDPFDSLTTLYEGASVTGNQMLEVPADHTAGVLHVTPELLADGVFVAVE